MMRTKRKEVFITRPTLAAYLFEQGFYGRVTVNAFHPELTAWYFLETPELKKAVEDWKAERGQDEWAK